MTNRKLYFFKCPKCGEYQTAARTFQKFCPPTEWQKIQKDRAAAGGLIEFEKQCPKCAPSGESLNKIILLRPKQQTLN